MRVDTHAAATAPPRVVIADRDDECRALYRRSLIDCDVLEASDGRDALAKALVRVPALVITEIRLPLIDGLVLSEILRRDRTTANVPIVITTLDSDPKDLDRARQLADVVLIKPLPSQMLASECARLIARGRRATESVDDLRQSTSESLGVSATVLTIAAELRDGTILPERTSAVKAHARFTTTTPPAVPPTLTCPSCDSGLIYDISYIGGVNEHHKEQWDYFACFNCEKAFQYRHRTRKLRALGRDEQRWLDIVRHNRLK